MADKVDVPIFSINFGHVLRGSLSSLGMLAKDKIRGDAGAKFDRAHFVESVLNPAAKIAQGFHTQKLVAGGDGGAGDAEYIGFVTRDSEEIHVRDVTGKVSILPAAKVKARSTLPGSIMPDGLAETLSLDDFASLLAYLESLKPQ